MLVADDDDEDEVEVLLQVEVEAAQVGGEEADLQKRPREVTWCSYLILPKQPVHLWTNVSCTIPITSSED